MVQAHTFLWRTQKLIGSELEGAMHIACACEAHKYRTSETSNDGRNEQNHIFSHEFIFCPVEYTHLGLTTYKLIGDMLVL